MRAGAFSKQTPGPGSDPRQGLKSPAEATNCILPCESHLKKNKA